VGRYRIVLADDHVLLRAGLKSILGKTAGLEVVGEAGDGLEVLNLLPKLKADMIILDNPCPISVGLKPSGKSRRSILN
jgi:DNA-binding NarL/FixJ family response regulator